MSLKVSIGIMAHNEEKNIGRLLQQFFSQQLRKVSISEIIIVSSGSTDKTNKIVKKFTNRKIKLIQQKKRLGKAAAVNIFLGKAREKILVLVSADILLAENTLENLVSPLEKADIGIVGSHPIPINNEKSFMGFTGHLIWDLHHKISLKTPKMGEVIAFRKIFKQIPIISSVDEANIEALIRGQGYKSYYAQDAVVYNKFPETIKEFINRRRHIFAGHTATKCEYNYEVATINGWKIFFLLLKNIQITPRFLLYVPLVILLESISRFLGYCDYKFHLKNHQIWERTETSKDLNKFKTYQENART